MTIEQATSISYGTSGVYSGTNGLFYLTFILNTAKVTSSPQKIL